MGAYPGPACYDLGGDNATLTDALLIAGMLNPDGFLGGKRQLSVELAREALDEHVASPLDASVEEAARLVIDAAVAIIEDAMRGVLDEAGYGDEGVDGFGNAVMWLRTGRFAPGSRELKKHCSRTHEEGDVPLDRPRITKYLDLGDEQWYCYVCGRRG